MTSLFQHPFHHDISAFEFVYHTVNPLNVSQTNLSSSVMVSVIVSSNRRANQYTVEILGFEVGHNRDFIQRPYSSSQCIHIFITTVFYTGFSIKYMNYVWTLYGSAFFYSVKEIGMLENFKYNKDTERSKDRCKQYWLMLTELKIFEREFSARSGLCNDVTKMIWLQNVTSFIFSVKQEAIITIDLHIFA